MHKRLWSQQSLASKTQSVEHQHMQSESQSTDAIGQQKGIQNIEQ